MQVEIVRHHRRAKNTDRHVQHGRVAHYLRRGNEAAEHRPEWWLGENYLEQEADADRGDEGDDQRLEQPESSVLQVEDHQHVERGDDYAVCDWDPKQEIEGDGGTDDFGEVAGGDRNLARNPQHEVDGWRIMVAAGLSEISPRHDAEL